MSMPTCPDWLARRDGSIRPGVRGFTALVAFSQKPQYKLEVRPAKGKFACVVTQTINGRLIDDATAEYPTGDAAFTGGLDRLREKLGW